MALKRSRQSSALKICNFDASCSFDGYQCSLPRIEGFEYCIRHILEDKTSPFRQCSYVYSNNSKRCFKPSPITEKKESYCTEHSLQALKKKQLISLKEPLNPSPELCLNQLSHHQISPSALQNAIPDPANVSSIASTALQYISQNEGMNYFSELDVRLLPRAEDDSELDSAESDADPLEHAVVFTTEEASRIYLEKLQKLKALYTGEFKRLHYLLRENRRQYLQAAKIENETLESIHAQPKETVDEREAYQELKFLSRFHHPLGKEALLVKQSNEKRALSSDVPGAKSNSTVGGVKCIYSEGSWRCGTKSIPLSKYCFKHIMQDERQVLFRSCGSLQGGGEECEIPIIPLPYTSTCIYHTPLINPLPVSEPVSSHEGNDSFIASRPKIIDLTDSSTFIISEIPPKDVMEGDIVANGRERGQVLSATEQTSTGVTSGSVT